MPAQPSWRTGLGTLFGLLAATGLGVAFAWVAFGPGDRHCSVSVSIPLLTNHGIGGETLCRGAFGVAMMLALAVFLVAAAAALRLLAPGRVADALEKAGQWLGILVVVPPILALALLASPLWLVTWLVRRRR